MELDDLKDAWKLAEKNQTIINNNIMELIRHKSYGPIAALKRRFRKQMILMPMMLVLVIASLSEDHKILTSIMFWCYIVFCFSLSLYFYFNYNLVKKMECMDCMIKSNLERQIEILEKRLKWQITGVRFALILFIALAELLIYFQPGSMLLKWHSVAPWMRTLIYAGLLVLQYFLSRALSHYKYGQHLSYLKELVKEMQ
jgi:hypothetical protein